jgi:hypothetical protein
MTLEQFEKQIENHTNYYKKRIEHVDSLKEKSKECLILLNSIKEDLNISLFITDFTIKTNSYEESWELAVKVLDRLETEKIQKIFQSRNEETPGWQWEILYIDGIKIIIYPAEPADSCIPTQKINIYKSWECLPI